MPTIKLMWPSATAVSANPPVIHATAAQPICTMVLRAAMSLLGHQPNAYRDMEIWRRPVGAPKVAAKPVAAPPRIEAKIVMTMDWRSAGVYQPSSFSAFAAMKETDGLLNPNSQPRKPVAKQLVFIVPDAHRKNMLSW